VADVEKFPGHIACDAASASEIVVPILQDGKVSFLFFLLCLSSLFDRLSVSEKVEKSNEGNEADCCVSSRSLPSSMSIVLSRMALTTKTRSIWKSLQNSLPNLATFEAPQLVLLEPKLRLMETVVVADNS
jgi:hypothetical protein